MKKYLIPFFFCAGACFGDVATCTVGNTVVNMAPSGSCAINGFFADAVLPSLVLSGGSAFVQASADFGTQSAPANASVNIQYSDTYTLPTVPTGDLIRVFLAAGSWEGGADTYVEASGIAGQILMDGWGNFKPAGTLCNMGGCSYASGLLSAAQYPFLTIFGGITLGQLDPGTQLDGFTSGQILIQLYNSDGSAATWPTGDPPAVPEPATFALGGIGILALFLRTRRAR